MYVVKLNDKYMTKYDADTGYNELGEKKDAVEFSTADDAMRAMADVVWGGDDTPPDIEKVGIEEVDVVAKFLNGDYVHHVSDTENAVYKVLNTNNKIVTIEDIYNKAILGSDEEILRKATLLDFIKTFNAEEMADFLLADYPCCVCICGGHYSGVPYFDEEKCENCVLNCVTGVKQGLQQELTDKIIKNIKCNFMKKKVGGKE